MPTLSPSFPPIDAAIAAARRINWQRTAHSALMLLATVAAVTVAVTLWSIRTGRQFWADHGTTIKTTARTVATRTATTAVIAWQVASPILARLANRAADAVYYWICNGRPITLPLPAITMAL